MTDYNRIRNVPLCPGRAMNKVRRKHAWNRAKETFAECWRARYYLQAWRCAFWTYVDTFRYYHD